MTQKLAIVRINDYAYLVPCIQEGEEIFLKTIIPSRKATNKYMGVRRSKKVVLDEAEKDILESIDRGEWIPVKNPKQEIRKLREYARNTLQKGKRINILVSAKDLDQVRATAAQEGIPHQTWVSSIIHKYVSGYLIERNKA